MPSSTFNQGQASVTCSTDSSALLIGLGNHPHLQVELLEVTALDLYRALGRALDAIQKQHGRSLKELMESLGEGS